MVVLIYVAKQAYDIFELWGKRYLECYSLALLDHAFASNSGKDIALFSVCNSVYGVEKEKESAQIKHPWNVELHWEGNRLIGDVTPTKVHIYDSNGREMTPKSESELSLEDELTGFIMRAKEDGKEVSKNDFLVRRKEIEIRHLIPSHEILWNPRKGLEEFEYSYKRATEKLVDFEPFAVAEIIVITKGKDRERYFILDGNGRWRWCLGRLEPYEKIGAISICLKNRYQYETKISDLLKTGTTRKLIEEGKPCRYNYLRYWILDPSLSKMEQLLVPQNHNPCTKYEHDRFSAFIQFKKIFRSEQRLWRHLQPIELL